MTTLASQTFHFDRLLRGDNPYLYADECAIGGEFDALEDAELTLNHVWRGAEFLRLGKRDGLLEFLDGTNAPTGRNVTLRNNGNWAMWKFGAHQEEGGGVRVKLDGRIAANIRPGRERARPESQVEVTFTGGELNDAYAAPQTVAYHVRARGEEGKRWMEFRIRRAAVDPKLPRDPKLYSWTECEYGPVFEDEFTFNDLEPGVEYEWQSRQMHAGGLDNNSGGWGDWMKEGSFIAPQVGDVSYSNASPLFIALDCRRNDGREERLGAFASIGDIGEVALRPGDFEALQPLFNSFGEQFNAALKDLRAKS